MKYHYELTEPVDTGLDKIIKDENGKAVGWAYSTYDAVIMASAPELLDALEAISNDARSWLCGKMDGLNTSELMQAFTSAADQAIAKAKGEIS